MLKQHCIQYMRGPNIFQIDNKVTVESLKMGQVPSANGIPVAESRRADQQIRKRMVTRGR